MVTFELSDEIKDMQTMVKGFAMDKLRAHEAYRKAEKAREAPEALQAALDELGLHLLEVPESLDGLGQDIRATVVVAEELAYGDVGLAVALSGFHQGFYALRELCSEDQLAEILPDFLGGARLSTAFTEGADPVDPDFITTTWAEQGDHYLITGSKSFVQNAGKAEAYVVLAKQEGSEGWEGVKAFFVPGDAPGLIAGERLRTLGLETCHFADLAFMGVSVPKNRALPGKTGDLRADLERALHCRRVLTSAWMVGAMRASSDYAFKYAEERQAFGQPIKDFQGLAFFMADIAIEVEAQRWLVWKAAWALATQENAEAEVFAALGQVVEQAQKAATDCVQVLGGHGYIQDHPVEKWMRDVRTLALIPSTDLFWSHGLAAALWEA